jgi:putative transposase
MEIILSKEDEAVLDGQSKICNWLYNHLLEMVKEDYKNGNKNEYLKGRNLRDQVPKLKEI